VSDQVTSMRAQRAPRGEVTRQRRAARVAPAVTAVPAPPVTARPPNPSIEAISIGEPIGLDSLASLLLANYAPNPRPVLKLISDGNARSPIPTKQ
jgi:hypothetical protein